jgi:hypothetical protein
MPDARCARSLVCELEKAHKHSHHGHTGTARHSPRNGFTGSFVLFPGTGLSCPRHRRKSASADLTPASGRQNHTTSPSATSSVRLCAPRVHRIPHPTFVTTAKRPSWRVWDQIALLLFLPNETAKYFRDGAGQMGKSVCSPRERSDTRDRQNEVPDVAAVIPERECNERVRKSMAPQDTGEMDSGSAPDGASRNDEDARLR